MGVEASGSTSQFRAARAARMAREMLGGCLGDLQEIPEERVSVEPLLRRVAQAVGALFAVQASEPDEPAHTAGVVRALGEVREALRILQEAEGAGDPAMRRAAESLARVMAVLHPLSRAQERVHRTGSIAAPRSGPPGPRPPRRSRRISVQVDIGFQRGAEFFPGLSEDVSAGGVFVATRDPLPLGAHLNVSFTLPDGHTIAGQGEVCWVREANPAIPDLLAGMGVRFLELGAEDRAAIERYLGAGGGR